MKKRNKLGLVILVIALCAVCDQALKAIAGKWLASSAPVSLWNDLVRFEYSENTGALLSLGADLPRLVRLLATAAFTSITLTAALALAFDARGLNWVQIFGVSLVAGGGVGNLIDRLFNDGAVVDFVSLGVGPLRTGIFNLADVAIIGGVLMLLVYRHPREFEAPEGE